MLKDGCDIRIHRTGRGISLGRMANMIGIPIEALRAFERGLCETPNDVLSKAQQVFEKYDRKHRRTSSKAA